MGDTFAPRLLNGPFGDPVLYVSFRYKRRAFLFDLGGIDSLSLRELHRVSHIFVSHAHMDHFVGFDHFLRSALNRESEVNLYGPRGFIDNVRGRLAGYTWNLIDGYPLKLLVHEIDETSRTTVPLPAAMQFRPEQKTVTAFDGTLLEEAAFKVRAAILDHGIPCLAFRLEEKTRFNIRHDRLQAMALETGPWLSELKHLLVTGARESSVLEIPAADGKKVARTLAEWREALVLVSEGQKICYVVDNGFSPQNIDKIVDLAAGVDQFYCEATFSETDAERAKERSHLTATQAGNLARWARAKRFIPFHFSPRYESEPRQLWHEAMEAFAKGRGE